MKTFWKGLLWLTNWKIEGVFPKDTKKMVIIVAPHTSNWDFFIGLMARGGVGFNSNFLGKDSLFKFPFGWFFKSIGGIPVNRNSSQKLVTQVAHEVAKRDAFVLALAPEGTRRSVTKWKTGFYYIALETGIPILICQMDWEKRAVRFLEPLFYPTGDIEKDLPLIQSRFSGIKGYADLKKRQ